MVYSLRCQSGYVNTQSSFIAVLGFVLCQGFDYQAGHWQESFLFSALPNQLDRSRSSIVNFWVVLIEIVSDKNGLGAPVKETKIGEAYMSSCLQHLLCWRAWNWGPPRQHSCRRMLQEWRPLHSQEHWLSLCRLIPKSVYVDLGNRV